MNKRDEVLSKIVRTANANFPDSEIYLYGSKARGDYGKFSDWDLLVLLNVDNVPFVLETKLMDDFYDIELETGEVISPLIYSKIEWSSKHTITPLYDNIQKEGIRIK